jgi:leader peptidase (prepilin peptidase) / N-methyltransferase
MAIDKHRWPRIGVVTTAALALLGVVVQWADAPVTALGLAAYTVTLARLSEIDLAQHRLPNRIVGPLAIATAAWVIGAGAVDGDPGRVIRALGAGVGASALLLVVSFVGQLGMGDVKLAFPVGLVASWLGAGAGRATVVTTALSGAVVAGALMAMGRGRQTLPYGPFLALGSVVGILVAGRA